MQFNNNDNNMNNSSHHRRSHQQQQQPQRRRRPHNNRGAAAGGVLLTREAIREGQRYSAVRLRKRRREERLNARRRHVPGDDEDDEKTVPKSPVVGNNKADTTALRRSLETVLLDGRRRRPATGNDDTVSSSLVALRDELDATGSHGTAVLRELLTDTERSCALLRVLLQRIAQRQQQRQQGNRDDDDDTVALDVLIRLAAPEASPDSHHREENYYGAHALQWCDLFLDAAAVIMDLWQRQLNDDAATTSSTCRAWSAFVGLLLARDATAWSSRVAPHWPSMVRRLPHTAHACAALLYYDHGREGSFYWYHLPSSALCRLLSSSSSDNSNHHHNNHNNNNHVLAAEAAWMIEGLTRREPASAERFVNDVALVSRVLTLLQHAPSSWNCPPTLALPLWRAVGHAAAADRGQYGTLLLERHHDTLIAAGTTLLRQAARSTTTTTTTITTAVLVEALMTLQCLLCDAGRPGHAATLVALPAWLPALCDLLASPATVFDVRRQVLRTVALTLGPPPSESTAAAASASPTNRMTSSSTLEPPPWTVEPWTLSTVVRRYVVREDDDDHAQTLRNLLQVIMDALRGPDAESHVSALRILDVLLRHHGDPTRPYWLDIPESVDVLEAFLTDDTTPAVVSELAADLLDEFLAQDDDDDEDGVVSSPTQGGHHHRSPSWFNNPLTRATSGGSTSAGRGRGRVVPAWLSRAQSR